MGKMIRFMQSNRLLQGIILCSSFVFPLICIAYLQGSGLIAFQYIWVAFYSSLLVCLAYKSLKLKIFICGLNLLFATGLVMLFLMGGTEIIPGTIWNALVPFLPNPWY